MKTMTKYLGCVLMLLAVAIVSEPVQAASGAMSCVAKEKNRVTENAIDSVLINDICAIIVWFYPKQCSRTRPL